MRDLNPIAAFCAVAQEGSLTKAAARLGQSKSTVSRWLVELEERLGVRLLERTSRGVVLTDSGVAFLTRATQGLSLLEAAEADVAGGQASARGLLRVTATPDFGELYLTEALSGFAHAHPEVRVELLLTTRRMDLIAERIDVAIRVGPLEDSSLVARRLGASGRVVVASPAYLERHPAPQTPEALREHACLSFLAREGVSRWEFHTPTGRRKVELTPRLTAENFRVLLDWALEGLGVALLPKLVCARELRDGRLVALLEKFMAGGEALYVVHASTRHVPGRVRALVDFLVRRWSPPPWDVHTPAHGPPRR